MKLNKKLSYNLETLLIPILSILFILLIVISILLGNEYYKNRKLNQDLIKLSTTNKELKRENSTLKNNQVVENGNYIYDCSFTKTYNIVYLMEGYISEVPEYSYIVVDEYQSHYAKTIRIPTELKKDLKFFEYYEITYHLKGKTNEIIDDMEYINNNISMGENKNFNITIEIKETDKSGNEQINEEICSYQEIE